MAINITQPLRNGNEAFGSNHGIQIAASGTTTYNHMLVVVNSVTVYIESNGVNQIQYRYPVSAPGVYTIKVVGVLMGGTNVESDPRTITVVQGVIGNRPISAMGKGTISDLTRTLTPNIQSGWHSTNTSVATVNSNGRVTAVNAGSATIQLRIDTDTVLSTCPVSVTVGNPLTMPQKWSNRGESGWIFTDGCYLSCLINTAAYYNNRLYTVQNMIDLNAYNPSSYTYNPANYPNFNVGSDIQSNLLSTIKTELDANRPVFIHVIKSNTTPLVQHWVLAYRYTGSASSNSDIYVLDSNNGNTNTPSVAVERTLTQVLANNNNMYDTVNKIRKTSRK